MGEFENRQGNVLNQAIREFKSGSLSLQGLINRIEAISGAIGNYEIEMRFFQIVSDLEQLNAAIATGRKTSPSADDREIIARSMSRLEEIIASYLS